MINQTFYTVDTLNGPVQLTITPVNSLLPNGDFYRTGVYRLTNGTVGMGEIVFDEDMSEWTYNGMDELNWEEAADVADFIRNYQDPAGADPNLP
ncbi:MAG TPA: hypothetical protein VHA56_10030 [Mucilaginibacter sp.]|nr:hypothetical protein [Mucilaginibacter sp.]